MPIILTANLVPVPPVPAALIDPAAGTPITSGAFVIGATSGTVSKLNQNSTRVDLIARWGGGGYAVVRGLDISAGAGLSLTIAAGQAMIDGPVTLPSGGALALTNGITRAYIWLSALGALLAVNNSLAAPAGAYAFLGSAVTSGGSITSVDQSGILYLRGGRLERWTADVSCPLDSPPSSLSFINKGASGCWMWTGQEYVCLSGGCAPLTYSSDADKTLSAREQANSFIDLTNAGTTLTATRKCIVPLEAGRQWIVRNNSPGAQSIQVIGASGTGVTITNGHLQQVASDGVNVVPISALV